MLVYLVYDKLYDVLKVIFSSKEGALNYIKTIYENKNKTKKYKRNLHRIEEHKLYPDTTLIYGITDNIEETIDLDYTIVKKEVLK